MVRNIRSVTFLCVCMTKFLLAGCSTVKILEYTASSFEEQRWSGSTDELELALTPLNSKQDIKKYFGTNLVAKGILPIYVIVRNVSADNAYIIPADSFQLVKPSSRSGNIGSDLDESNFRTVTSMAGAVLVSPVLLIAGANLAANERIIEHNFERKKFTTDTLRPGQEASGFLYFPIPDEVEKGDRWRLALMAKEFTGGEKHLVSAEIIVQSNCLKEKSC